MRHSNHRRIFRVTQILFLQNFQHKTKSLHGQVVQDMLAKRQSVKSRIFSTLQQCIFPLKCPMVICPYSVHITMANFSRIFRHENSSLKCSDASFYVKKDIQCWFWPFICSKVEYFLFIMYRGYIVAMRHSNHRRIFMVTQILFLQNFQQKT